ncbi:MAG: hypothetical protein WCC17_22580 [Candidatus Nitrosopolaris sp.]
MLLCDQYRYINSNPTSLFGVINELQSSLAQKRKEMAYMDHESGKYDNTGKIYSSSVV